MQATPPFGAGGPHQAGVSPVAADHAGVGAGLRRAGADRAGLRHQHRQGRREERARGAGRPFPTQYQLEQLGKLVLVDRTRPTCSTSTSMPTTSWWLPNRSARRRCLIASAVSWRRRIWWRAAFGDRCRSGSGSSPPCWGRHRSAPLPRPAGAPHPGLYRAGPAGSTGATASATLVFVLAIAKADYEEAMGLYDLFLALMNEKASRNLLACRDFAAFKALARSAP